MNFEPTLVVEPNRKGRTRRSRNRSGEVRNNVRLYLEVYDQKIDERVQERIGWRAARLIFGADLLSAEVAKVRGTIIG